MIEDSIDILFRIPVIHTIDTCSLHNNVSLNLQGAQNRSRVSGKIWITGFGGKNDHPFMLQVVKGFKPLVRLADIEHGDGRHDLGGNTEALKTVLYSEGIHHSAKHAHIIGGTAIHATGSPGNATEDVPRPDHQGEFNLEVMQRLNFLGQVLDYLRADAIGSIPHQGLTTDLQKDSFEFHFAALLALLPTFGRVMCPSWSKHLLPGLS